MKYDAIEIRMPSEEEVKILKCVFMTAYPFTGIGGSFAFMGYTLIVLSKTTFQQYTIDEGDGSLNKIGPIFSIERSTNNFVENSDKKDS